MVSVFDSSKIRLVDQSRLRSIFILYSVCSIDLWSDLSRCSYWDVIVPNLLLLREGLFLSLLWLYTLHVWEALRSLMGILIHHSDVDWREIGTSWSFNSTLRRVSDLHESNVLLRTQDALSIAFYVWATLISYCTYVHKFIFIFLDLVLNSWLKVSTDKFIDF